MVAPLAPRTGRKAIRSSSTALAITTTMASGRRDEEGQAEPGGEDQDIAGQGHQRAMGEIDEAEDRVDDRQPEGEQGVDAAEAQRIAGLLEEIAHHAGVTSAREPPR